MLQEKPLQFEYRQVNFLLEQEKKNQADKNKKTLKNTSLEHIA